MANSKSSSQGRAASRRPPLTPSTVSSPCISTHAPIATRRDSGSCSPTRASALLAKVASHPTTPRGDVPAPNAMPSPPRSSPIYTPERPQVWRSESDRYVRQYRQQDGYISFPDFDKFSPNSYESQHHREHAAVRT